MTATIERPAGQTLAARGRLPDLLGEIAARRRSDLSTLLAGRTSRDLARAAAAASPPRPIAEMLARPGCHLIAEIKRRSPSAGALVPFADPAAVARAYEAGGASGVSVLCEPHWFGGSMADIGRVRGQVRLPVLAKEFVVDRRQLPLLRAAGADAVLLIAALHPPLRLRRLVDETRDLGMEPLVEAHDERDLERVLGTGALLVGINRRDLRTLSVDPGRVERLRQQVPEDRLVIGESGVDDPATVAAWRAAGVDAALIGETLLRGSDPATAVRSFVAAGRDPGPTVATSPRPFVKICGIVDEDGVLAAVRAGADAIGLNVVAGTRRALTLAEAAALARLARAASASGGGPTVVAITADAPSEALEAIVEAVDPDVLQSSGDEPAHQLASSPRPVWKVLHAGPDTAAEDVVERARRYLATDRCARIILDAADPAVRGGTGRRVDPGLARAVAKRVPLMLAGGLDAGSVGAALRDIPAIGVDTASGVEGPRRAASGRPWKDPLRVALFVKRAHAARVDRPHLTSGPLAVPTGLVEADDRGRWGISASFGGRYVPETLVAALDELDRSYRILRHDPGFWASLRELLATFAGRPTPLHRADRLASVLLAGSGAPRGLRLYLKREDLAHTGAHKINNAVGQVLLAQRAGRQRVIAETGAGQHGTATAAACALLGLPCTVYMGSVDMERQRPNVTRMQQMGAEVRPVSGGSATLKDAINEAMRDWVTNVGTTHYVLGSAMGPHPYPTIVRDFQRVIGDEAAAQVLAVEGRLPDLVVACVGGGSNAVGLLSRFIGEPDVRLVAVEAAGEGLASGRHAAALARGSVGILHGARTLMLQDDDGQILEAHSISAGLDYPGVGPQLAALLEADRLEVTTSTDREATDAMRLLARTEGILPALEPAHALAALPRMITDAQVVLVGLSGRGDKDMAALEPRP